MSQRNPKPPIECKSEIGITIGLIDAMITLARVIDGRLDYDAMIIGTNNDKYHPIRAALRDLASDGAMRKLIGEMDSSASRLIQDIAEHFTRHDPREGRGDDVMTQFHGASSRAAVHALRTPDPSLKAVANTVRQSIADEIELLQKQVDRYGLALMMIRQGAKDPYEVANEALTTRTKAMS